MFFRENQLREHLLQLQTQEEDLRRREEVLSLNLNNVNLDDNQINLPIKHDSIKSSECHHQWWTYIWHSLQQQSSSTEIDKCDNIVESQGLTIVKLRQVVVSSTILNLLGTNLGIA